MGSEDYSKKIAGEASTVEKTNRPNNFIRAIIDEDLQQGVVKGKVTTRFPPEPNGYLHIGHAKSICLNFGLAKDYQGTCHLRFDDTNPTTEDIEYVEAMQRDIKWLGFDWGANKFYASDYFETFYSIAESLITKGLAYVDSLDEEAIREYRGTVTQPGKPSPFRDRSVDENLDLFRRMKAGDFKEGEHVLRAKIDLASPNMKMRDPLLYRIRHAHHYRTGDSWCIYPLYDYAHPLSDAIEGITHSVCTLEFENNREVYDWVVANADLDGQPHQYEFARLNLNYTVMSKRKLLQLVTEKTVLGWDDPRMLTIAGMRRRGYTPESLRDFCERIGVAKANSTVDMTQLEFSVRNDLNKRVPRVMAILRPLKVIVENMLPGDEQALQGDLYPHDIPLEGKRTLPFTKELYIEQTDFSEDPPKGFYRLKPGGEVRLRHSYVIRCNRVEKDPETGAILALHCSYDPETLGKNPTDRKVKGTVHWVSKDRGVPAEFRLYDRLFMDEKPEADGRDFRDSLNKNSLTVLKGVVEPSIAEDAPGTKYQFERTGYFCSDINDSSTDHLIYNLTVGLKDGWSKQKAKQQPSAAAKPKQVKKEKPIAQPQKQRQWTATEQEQITSYTQKGLSSEVAETLVGEPTLAKLFEAAADRSNHAGSLANWIVNEWSSALKQDLGSEMPYQPEDLAVLVNLVQDQKISASTAKKVFAILRKEGGSPETIVSANGWQKIQDDTAIIAIIQSVLEKEADALARYRAGNAKLFGFFVGRVMKETKGLADAKLINSLLKKCLDS